MIFDGVYTYCLLTLPKKLYLSALKAGMRIPRLKLNIKTLSFGLGLCLIRKKWHKINATKVA